MHIAHQGRTVARIFGRAQGLLRMKGHCAFWLPPSAAPIFAQGGASFRRDALHGGCYHAVGVPKLADLAWKLKAQGRWRRRSVLRDVGLRIVSRSACEH
jgi:hypothetical protein